MSMAAVHRLGESGSGEDYYLAAEKLIEGNPK